mmetsp:Transcript_1724/g.4021  ORF Transcript_1724/g.4021 Transcript_1724/m.4021 type:complete len:102 (+) Transcript_1724:92-397(+)
MTRIRHQEETIDEDKYMARPDITPATLQFATIFGGWNSGFYEEEVLPHSIVLRLEILFGIQTFRYGRRTDGVLNNARLAVVKNAYSDRCASYQNYNFHSGL